MSRISFGGLLAVGAALIFAGLLSVVIFPVFALGLLAQERRPAPSPVPDHLLEDSPA